MKNPAKESDFSDTTDNKPHSIAANHSSVKEPPDMGPGELDRIREILLGQFATAQAEKLSVLQTTLFDQLNQHINTVNTRLDSMQQSMDTDRVSAQQSDELIREQLKTSFEKATDDLARSQDVVQSQLSEIQDVLSKKTMSRQSIARALSDIARKLDDEEQQG